MNSPLLGADTARLPGSTGLSVTGLTGELVLCRHKIITPFKARQYLNGSGGGGGSAQVKGLPPETTAESEQVPGQVSQLEDTVSLCNPTPSGLLNRLQKRTEETQRLAFPRAASSGRAKTGGPGRTDRASTY